MSSGSCYVPGLWTTGDECQCKRCHNHCRCHHRHQRYLKALHLHIFLESFSFPASRYTLYPSLYPSLRQAGCSVFIIYEKWIWKQKWKRWKYWKPATFVYAPSSRTTIYALFLLLLRESIESKHCHCHPLPFYYTKQWRMNYIWNPMRCCYLLFVISSERQTDTYQIAVLSTSMVIAVKLASIVASRFEIQAL